MAKTFIRPILASFVASQKQISSRSISNLPVNVLKLDQSRLCKTSNGFRLGLSSSPLSGKASYDGSRDSSGGSLFPGQKIQVEVRW